MNENVETIYRNPEDTKKAALRGKFMVMRAYVKKKTEIAPINNVMRHWTALDKQEQTSSWYNSWKQIIKNATENNEMKMKKYKETMRWRLALRKC